MIVTEREDRKLLGVYTHTSSICCCPVDGFLCQPDTAVQLRLFLLPVPPPSLITMVTKLHLLG